MFDYIYCSPQLTVEHNKAEHVVRTLMDLYMESPQLLPREYGELADRFGLKQTVVDFVGGLTDAGAVQLFNIIKHKIAKFFNSFFIIFINNNLRLIQ